jgi:hypothetical protein
MTGFGRNGVNGLISCKPSKRPLLSTLIGNIERGKYRNDNNQAAKPIKLSSGKTKTATADNNRRPLSEVIITTAAIENSNSKHKQ